MRNRTYICLMCRFSTIITLLKEFGISHRTITCILKKVVQSVEGAIGYHAKLPKNFSSHHIPINGGSF